MLCCGEVSISISIDGGGMNPDFCDAGDGEFFIGVVLVGRGIWSGDSLFGIFISFASSLMEPIDDDVLRRFWRVSELLRDFLDSVLDSALDSVLDSALDSTRDSVLDCALDEALDSRPEVSPSDLLELALLP